MSLRKSSKYYGHISWFTMKWSVLWSFKLVYNETGICFCIYYTKEKQTLIPGIATMNQVIRA